MTTSILRIQLIALMATSMAAAAELSDAEKERFLKEADIVSSKELSIGVTLSHRVTMVGEGLTHAAHFQDVDEFKRLFKGRTGREANFRDCYRYNIAAYRLDRMLDLRMTPVSVERKYKGRTGAVTWWVDDALMMDLDRYKQKIAPPDPQSWNHQMHHVRLFNELVYNTDANRGNVIIDESWDIWLVDFTRAFRMHKKPRNAENLTGMIDRRIWERLLTLDEARLRSTVGDVLLNSELRGLVARREAIVRITQARIDREGEAAVICDRPGH